MSPQLIFCFASPRLPVVLVKFNIFGNAKNQVLDEKKWKFEEEDKTEPGLISSII